MFEQVIRAKEVPHITDTTNQMLCSLLRGLEIERRRQNSSVHLLSTDPAQVESLVLVLDQLTEAQTTIQKYLEGETQLKKASEMLNEITTNAVNLRRQLWPSRYRACEALTRMIDILSSIGRSFF